MSIKIESIRLKNFKAFKDVTIRDIPRMCVVVGANGAGKSTLFDVFGFLRDSLTDNVQVALNKRGGFKEVRTREAFNTILKKLAERVPGISKVEAKTSEEGRVLLRFQDGAFKDPFLARYVSDGTIKMFAYLVLLYDPSPHPLLCVEEPENQLYPKLLYELAEEFSAYASKGSQVFISTHSPDFLNAVELDSVFWLVKDKENGVTHVKRAKDDEQIAAFMAEGDKMGYLWKQGFFEGVDPL